MFKTFVDRWWMIVVVVLAAVLSGCGSLSGEPKTVSEIEVLPEPTIPAPATATPVEQSTSPGAAEDMTPQPTFEPVSGGYDPASADFDRGMQVYLSQCAVCHGASKGVGPSLSGMGERAAELIAGMSAADYLYQSIVDPGAFLVEGYENVMPATYGRDLTAQDINDVIKFILEFDPALMMQGAQATPVPGATPVSQEDVLTVRGRLVQGTANGEPIPAGLAMELYALNIDGDLVGTYETQSGEDGAYRFDNVARAAGDVYVVQVTYDDIPQGAQIQAIQGSENEVTSDVTLYERTTDPSTVAITWAQILINFAPIEEFGMEVWLSLELANTGDKIVTTDQTAGANNWFVSTSLQLPVGAFGIQPMQAETSQRYDVQEVDGVPEVRDTWPLRPGQVHTITVAYYLPYESGAVIDQSFSYPVVDAVVLVPNDTVSFSSDQLDVTGEWCCRVDHGGVRVTELGAGEKIDPDKDFTLVKSHDLDTPLKANERLIFELTGRPTRTLDVIATGTPSSSSNSTTGNLLPMILAAAGGAIITLAGVLWWRQRTSPPPAAGQPVPAAERWQPPAASAGKEELLKAVAELDDAYESGNLDNETYQERREILLERLLPLMEDEKP